MVVIGGIVADQSLRVAPDAALRMVEPMPGPALTKPQCWQNDRVALGARSSDATALHEDQHCVVVADARLDNRRELCADLDVHEARVSDAAVIAAGYAAFGEGVVRRLRGEFAFAIWNRASNTLICARDRFGLRPLVYRKTARSLRIASDPRALACDTGLSALEANDDWIVDYIWGAVTSFDQTPYKGISRLPPAHLLRFEHGRLEIAPYWSFSEVSQEEQAASSEQVRGALVEAVRRRMRDPAVGAFLSGGLDSSSICCVAGQLRKSSGGPPLPTVSMVFDATPAESERPHIEAVLAKGEFLPTIVDVPDYRPIAALERLVALQDGPFFAPGLALIERGLAVAANAGLHAVLDGHGGDETLSFAGYGRLSELAQAQSWASLSRELTSLTRTQGGSRIQIGSLLFARYGRGPLARVWRRLYPMLRRRTLPPAEIRWLAKRWLADPAVEARHLRFEAEGPGKFATDREIQESTLASALQAYAFEVHTRLFRAYGIEPLFPFWDQDIVELSLRLPASQRLREGQTRAALREAVRGILPESVRLRRDKLDFSGHLVRGLLRDEAVMLDIANDKGAPCFDYVDRDAFVAGVEDVRTGSGLQRVRPAQGVLAATTLEIWLRSRRSATDAAHGPLETSS